VNIPPTITRAAGRAALIISKNSPQLLFAGGIAGFAGTVVLSCRATMKLEPILDEHDKAMEKWKTTRFETELERRQEIGRIYITSAVKIGRVFAPAAGMGILTIAMLTGSHHILSRRNLAMMAAYRALDEGFRQYRGRVAEELGPEKEAGIRHGATRDVLTDSSKEGEVEIKQGPLMFGEPSIYARFFDEMSVNWQAVPEMNLVYLRAQQDQANYWLKMRGHVFLNEVYDMLGIPRSQAGQVVGWMAGPGRGNYIDFGVYRGHERGRRFINGDEPAILLDFNIDPGIIWDEVNYGRAKQL
jgi:hypothetical protein